MTIESQTRGQGMVTFSAILLVTMGIMRILDGIWSLTQHGAAPHLQGGLLGSKLSTYGGVWIGVGALLILAGVGVVLRVQAARWFGVAAAIVACISGILWIPYYPVWAIVYIYLAVVVIYGLVVYAAPSEA